MPQPSALHRLGNLAGTAPPRPIARLIPRRRSWRWRSCSIFRSTNTISLPGSQPAITRPSGKPRRTGRPPTSCAVPDLRSRDRQAVRLRNAGFATAVSVAIPTSRLESRRYGGAIHGESVEDPPSPLPSPPGEGGTCTSPRRSGCPGRALSSPRQIRNAGFRTGVAAEMPTSRLESRRYGPGLRAVII